MKQPIPAFPEAPPAILCWSGGKDAAFALHKTLQSGRFKVKYLLTTLHAVHRRVSMHGVPETLIEQQAAAVGIPLLKMFLDEAHNAAYERQLEASLLQAREAGIRHVLFGDIFLEDLRRYREENLEKIGMQAVFPLWQSNTRDLVTDFIRSGFKTITCCVDASKLDRSQAGRELDEAFIRELPAEVDPCGEHGEYHSFCFDGPIFASAIPFRRGQTIYKSYKLNGREEADSDAPAPEAGFWFCELLPEPQVRPPGDA